MPHPSDLARDACDRIRGFYDPEALREWGESEGRRLRLPREALDEVRRVYADRMAELRRER